MANDYRIESDSMGEMKVPTSAYYGAQTARAVENFPISSLRFPRSFLRALGQIKKHAATANRDLKLLDPAVAQVVEAAAQEVADGKWDAEFVVDIFQTGSGTSTNMNANEVIARRASELSGGARLKVHPNDHVNRGQSSNDVIPSAIHLAALHEIQYHLQPALQELEQALSGRAKAFSDVLKIGRTHLQDATPIRLGQEFSGYASQVSHGLARLESIKAHLGELALGGTAVGTGINTHTEFSRRTIDRLAKETKLPLREATNHFEAQGARDGCVEASGALKTIAVSLIKIANDIRLLGSGPRCGIGELKLPATQPGSSIMPGKVNPVMVEMMIQVSVQVIGNDTVVTWSGAGGHLELNAMLPVMAHNLLQSIDLLGNGCRVFARRCVAVLEADVDRCRDNIEQSLAMCTALAPVIGYDRAAKIAKIAFEQGKTVREIAREQAGLEEVQLTKLLDPLTQTEPNNEVIGSGGG